MEIRQNSSTLALGCGGSLILLGSFISGFCLGHSQAQGKSIDVNMTRILKYAPAIIGGVYGSVSCNALINVPGNLESLVEDMPNKIGVTPEQKATVAKGCMPFFSGIFGSIMIGGLTYLGYSIGHYIGKSS